MRWTENVHKTVLSNGLTVLVERYVPAPVVATVAHVRAGYFDEPDPWVGISHVLEHMFFKGTPARPGGRLAEETQRLGGYLNAATIYDKTVYYSVLPSAPGALEAAVDLQSDALIRPLLDADDLARELEVIVQEAKRKLDSPGAVTRETLYETLFAQHRIRRWRIGTEAGLRALTAEDVREYHRTRYTPDRTIVAMIGDLDLDRAVAIAEDRFGAWAAPPREVESSPPEVDPPAPRFRTLRGDVERPMVTLGWRTVDALDEDGYALDVAATVLGRGRSSWLSRAVRTPGLASTVAAGHYTPTEVGVFDLTLEGERERIRDAAMESLRLVDRLADDGVDDGDLERARALVAMQWARRMESADGRALTLCEFEGLGGLELAERAHDATLAVGAEDVQRVADRYLRPDRASGVAYVEAGGPERGELLSWPPEIEEASTLEAVRWPDAGAGLAAVPGGRRPEPRQVGPASHVALDGADLIMKHQPGCGLVVLAWYAPGLRDAETSAVAGVSALLARSAVRGAGGLDAERLGAAAERLGGVIAPSVVSGCVGWTITVPKDAAAAATSLLVRVAYEADLESEPLAIERRLQVSDAARARDNMFGYPVSRVLGLGLPESPYGLPPLGEPETVAALSDEVVRDWAAKLRTTRPVFLAVGDLTVDAMIRDTLPALAERSGIDTAPGVMPPPDWVAGRGAEARDKEQTALAMAFPAWRHGDPRRPALAVTASLLGGLAGRLFHALRERRSLAYTVSAIPWHRRAAGAMLTYIATDPGREDEARAAMIEELEKVWRDPPTDEELTRARNYSAGEVQLRQQRARAVAAELLEAWIYGELATAAREADDLRAVSRDQVCEVAREVFRPDARAEYVVRGR